MHRKRKFTNLDPSIKPKGFSDFLKWKLTSSKPKWPSFQVMATIEKTDIPPPTVEDHKIRISYIGHVSFLIQTNSVNVLTDPVWSKRAGPMGLIGPRRVIEPGIKFEDLPKIDIILISHNHYDHMDLATIGKLCERDKPKIITPLENDRILRAAIPTIEVSTLNWSEKILVKNDTVIYLEAAQHWSARGLFDRNLALWGTFIIKTQKGSICFIGDSGYHDQLFKDIAKKHEDILISLIPIGAFEPRWFMKGVHMNPEEAVLVHQDLHSTYSIASHFETFQLANDTYDQAATELVQARDKYHISSEYFITPKAAEVYWF